MKVNNIILKIKKHKILFSILFIVTLFRIILASKLPMQLQADELYDDFLFIKYARSLLSLNWLGDFNYVTLVKGASFSFFIAFNYILGIPYNIGLILLYIISILIFIKAIRALINNKYFLIALYIFLLFSPMMLHYENVGKVYRGGVILSFALIIISSIIALYTRYNKDIKILKKWSILGSLSLSYFWFLKEDSVWMLPFVLVGIIVSIFKLIKEKYKRNELIKRSILIIMPLIILVISNITYKSINYFKYGEFTITDRNGTYYKEVLSDLVHIDDGTSDKKYWVTKSMMEKAYDASESLSVIKDIMDKKYKSSWVDETGEINGDIIYWVIREAFNEYGLYEKGGKEVNNYYKKIHNELTDAFNKGKLKKNKDLYISSISKGINKEELPEFLKLLKDGKESLITYKDNDLGLYPSTGGDTNLAFFSEMTNMTYIHDKVDNRIYNPSELALKISNKIVDIYKKTGKLLYYILVLELIVLSIKLLFKKLKEKEVFLIMVGIFLTALVLFVGTTFFCRFFFGTRRIYDYAASTVILIEVLEIFGIYYIIKDIKTIIKKVRK